MTFLDHFQSCGSVNLVLVKCHVICHSLSVLYFGGLEALPYPKSGGTERQLLLVDGLFQLKHVSISHFIYIKNVLITFYPTDGVVLCLSAILHLVHTSFRKWNMQTFHA